VDPKKITTYIHTVRYISIQDLAGAISEADGSDAVDASDAKTLANEDKPVAVCSTTASDAASSLIALSQEEKSKVGRSQEDAEDASEAKKLANVDTAEGSNTATDASPDSIATNEEENSEVGGGHKDALIVNEDNDDGSTTDGGSAPALIAPSQQGNSKVGGNQEDGNTGRPSDQENNEASIGTLLADYIPQVIGPLPIAVDRFSTQVRYKRPRDLPPTNVGIGI